MDDVGDVGGGNIAESRGRLVGVADAEDTAGGKPDVALGVVHGGQEDFVRLEEIETSGSEVDVAEEFEARGIVSILALDDENMAFFRSDEDFVVLGHFHVGEVEGLVARWCPGCEGLQGLGVGCSESVYWNRSRDDIDSSRGQAPLAVP